jgi:hypothetical protein
VDHGRPLVVVVRLLAADGTCVRSMTFQWAASPPAAEVLGELCVRALQARRDGCDLVVVEPAELVVLLEAAGLARPLGPVGDV